MALREAPAAEQGFAKWPDNTFFKVPGEKTTLMKIDNHHFAFVELIEKGDDYVWRGIGNPNPSGEQISLENATLYRLPKIAQIEEHPDAETNGVADAPRQQTRNRFLALLTRVLGV